MPACQGDAYFEAGRATTPSLMRRIEMPTQCYTFTDLKLRRTVNGVIPRPESEKFALLHWFMDGGSSSPFRGCCEVTPEHSSSPFRFTTGCEDCEASEELARSTIIHFECTHNDDNGDAIHPAVVQRASVPTAPPHAAPQGRGRRPPRKICPRFRMAEAQAADMTCPRKFCERETKFHHEIAIVIATICQMRMQVGDINRGLRW